MLTTFYCNCTASAMKARLPLFPFLNTSRLERAGTNIPADELEEETEGC